jgi:hypothetical protein
VLAAATIPIISVGSGSLDVFSKLEVKTLVEIRTVGCMCVSIYMPTFKPGCPEVQQNQSRYKNLLREAHEHLMQIGGKKAELSSLESFYERIAFRAKISF